MEKNKGRKSQRKGNRGEAELLQILLARGVDAHRNIQRWTGGKGNPDISAVWKGTDFHIEVKRRERLALYDALKQAETDADGGDAFPIVVHRTNRKGWVVSFSLEKFLDRFALPF